MGLFDFHGKVKNLFQRAGNYKQPWRFYSSRLIDSDSYYITPRGCKIRLRVRNGHSDRFVLDEIFCERQYEDIDLEGVETVIDIGAYSGYSAAYFSLNDCRVYSFEPGPAYENLVHNIDLNDLDVEAYRRPVSAEGQAVSLNGNSESTLVAKEDPEGVEAISLEEIVDNKVSENPDVLKMDCEGSEVAIIVNTPKNVIKKFKTIFLEYHSVNGMERIKSRLEDAGFEISLYDGHIGNEDVGFLKAENIDR